MSLAIFKLTFVDVAIGVAFFCVLSWLSILPVTLKEACSLGSWLPRIGYFSVAVSFASLELTLIDIFAFSVLALTIE